MASADPTRPAESSGATTVVEVAVDWGRLWALALLGGLLTGLGAWLVGESGLVHFRAGEERVKVMGGEMVGASPQMKARAALQDASAIFGISGGLLGVALGLAGGRARRPGRWAWGAAAVGLVLGGAAGALPPWVVIPLSNRTMDLSGADLGRSILVHAALWVAPGAAAGLALGLGLFGRVRGRAVEALLGGALGAFAGLAAYDLVGGVAFPLAGTGFPVSMTPATRLLARLLVALGAAAGASALASAHRTRRPVNAGRA